MYFPKSQITPNLYTNGNEFAYSSNKQEYIGYYFKVSTGKYFSGKNPDDRPNEELISLETDITTINTEFSLSSIVTIIDPIYSYIANQPVPPPTYIPSYNPLIPTQQDYQIGEFRRYFCKKVNEISYIEIDKDTHDKLVNKDSQIEYSLYIPFYISWQLTGDKQQVARTNKNIVELTMKRLSLPKFNLYLREDYTKYYQ
jgi:hypothetical protein